MNIFNDQTILHNTYILKLKSSVRGRGGADEQMDLKKFHLTIRDGWCLVFCAVDLPAHHAAYIFTREKTCISTKTYTK